MSKTTPLCRVCGIELTGENWAPSRQKKNSRICKSCHNKRYKQWQRANPDKTKAIRTRAHRKRGQRPMSKNKECSSFLGVHIAEQVLIQAFKNVQRMPMNNPGYDIVCNHNKLIDIKSACKQKNKNCWGFTIRHNTIADYFLCLAFDNREDLNPLHAWLIPGAKVNHLKGATISPSTIHKWDAYRLDISKINECCSAMKKHI